MLKRLALAALLCGVVGSSIEAGTCHKKRKCCGKSARESRDDRRDEMNPGHMSHHDRHHSGSKGRRVATEIEALEARIEAIEEAIQSGR